MVIIPVTKNAKHYERKPGMFIYRYGYQPINDDEFHVIACVEEVKIRYPQEVIKRKVENYCMQIGIPNEFNPADYGFKDILP